MGFFNPSAWFFAGLIAVLIALYLWERHRRHVDVPSLLLWEAVPEAIVRTTRFRPDWLFLLQLLLLAALIAGLAGPYLRGGAPGNEPTRRVFVLDVSASMQAREGRQTRFEQARGELRRRIESLGPQNETTLISAAKHPRVVSPFTRDRAALLQKVAELAPLDTGTNMELALAMAMRAAARPDRQTDIEVFTDLSDDQIDSAWRDRIGLFHFGESDDNLGIESLQVFQGRFQDYREARARVVVRNFSHREAHGFLTFRLDDRVLDRRGFTLQPRASGSFPIRNFPGPGILAAHLEVRDALDADNRAYGWIRPLYPVRLLVVSDSSPLQADLTRIAHATANLRLTFTTPAQYASQPHPDADVILFDRFVPAPPPDAATLYLFPVIASGWLAASGEAKDLRILDWDDHHPVLKSLRPELPFPIHRTRLLHTPAWADVLLTSRSGGREVPLAFAGEDAGQRTAVIAFDVSTDRLLSSDRLDLLLFFLNLLDWLAPRDASVMVLRTGSVRAITGLPARPRRVFAPDGSETTVPAGKPLLIEPVHVGEYRIAADGTGRRVLANLFDPSESDIGRSAQASPHERRPRTPAKPRPVTGQPVGLWLYGLAAALLLAEWFASSRRET
jgi:hypothetical protein